MQNDPVTALSAVISAIIGLSAEDRKRVVDAALAFCSNTPAKRPYNRKKPAEGAAQ